MSTYRLSDEMKKLTDLGITLSVYIDHGKPTNHEFKSEILDAMLADEDRIPYKPDEEGFLDREDEEARFSIVLRMPTRSDVAVVIASSGKEKKLSRLTNFSKTEYLTVKKISTYTILDGCTTKPPDNSFKIISTTDNFLRLFEVSIATRAHKANECLHFLTVQEVYNGQLYYNETLECVMVPESEYPGYRNWPSLRKLVSEMVDVDQLPRSVIPVPKLIPAVSEPNRGRVLFFNASTGVGLVKINGDQIAGLHWSKLNVKESFPYVKTGDEILFKESYTGSDGYIKIAGVTPV